MAYASGDNHWTKKPEWAELRKKNIQKLINNRFSFKGKHRDAETIRKMNDGKLRWQENNPDKYKESRAKAAKHFLGEGNPNWKGGISRGFKENNRINNPLWRKIRKVVINRDGSCQSCGAIENLIVHHIIEWSNGGSDDIENLVTGCRKCHVEYHKKTIDKNLILFKKGLQVAWNKGLKKI